MPELHSPLQDWVMQTVDSADLSSRERTGLVERFTDQCLNERYRSALVSLVERWTAHPTTGRKMEAAAAVLRRGLRDKDQGRSFRRQIYDWSCMSDTSGPLTQLVIEACRDEMMPRHPDEALVRLHHVARRQRGTNARETLVRLVSGAPRFLRQMLNRLTNPRFGPGKWPIDVDLFLELAEPRVLTDPGKHNHALISEDVVRAQLTTGWALAFARRPCEAWAPQAGRWLDVAAADERHRHVLLDILIKGGAGHLNVLARIYKMTREQRQWVSLNTLVIQKINLTRGARLA